MKLDVKYMALVILILALLIGLSGSANAATLKGGHLCCFTEQAFDELLEMAARGDRLGADYLVKSGRCFVSKEGVRISVIKSSWDRVKVRAYVGDSAMVFWAQPQSVQE